MRYLAALFLATLAISAFAKDKEIPLGGASLGMTGPDLQKLAHKRRCNLEGPGKKLMAEDVHIFVQDYVVARDKQLETVSGARRQVIMLLKMAGGTYQVVGVELWFKSKSSYTSYLARLKKLGYEEKDGKYIGKLLTGKYAGLGVEVKLGELAIAKRRSKYYTVQARCFEVLGKGITAEKIMNAQKTNGIRGRREGVGRAL